ncbi:MAG: hypothetical protein HZA25_02855 [Candidatus Niyogibacteria bacterium]|nr:hypothetical protein [Candidatus Niyogibacteria bacterium]
MPSSIGGFDVYPELAAPEPRKPAPAGEIPAIHTLRGDIQAYTQKSKTSYFDIVAASQKKRRTLGVEWTIAPQYLRTAVIAAAAAALLALLTGGYFLFAKKQTPPVAPIARPAASLIYADNEQILEYAGDKKLLLDDIQIVLAKPQLTNEFTYLPIKTRVANADVFFGPTDLLSAAGAAISAELGSALTTPFTFGVIDTFGKNETVLLLKAVSYDKTLAALLAWEKTMPRDLDKLLPKNTNRDYGELKFKDVVVKNQDARILANLEGRGILAYTIFNRKLVVITSSKAALEAVIDKLIASPR